LKGVKFSPDGVCYLTAADDNCLRIYDIPPSIASVVPSTTLGDENLDNNNTNVSCSKEEEEKNDPYFPALRINAGELIYDYAWYPWANATDPATCCFAVTTRAHPIHLYDAVSGQLRCSYRPFNNLDEMDSAYSISFSPDGSKIFAGGRNSVIYIFDVNRPGRDHETFFTYSKKDDNRNSQNGAGGGQRGIISCIACAQDASGLMAAGSYSGIAALYDYRIPTQQLAVLEGHTGGITHLKFSPCGTYLYTGARKDSLIYCWDARNMSGAMYQLQRDVNTTNQRIYFDIEPCGRHLASGGEDGFIKLWDLRDGSEAGKFKVAENDTVNGCEFHPSLPVLATATGHRRFFAIEEESSSSDEEEEEGCDDGGDGDANMEGGSEGHGKVKYVRIGKGQFDLNRDQNSLRLWSLGMRAAMDDVEVVETAEEDEEFIEIT
jgi:telomerase Cajal body protein 1